MIIVVELISNNILCLLFSDILEVLLTRLEEYRVTMVPPRNQPSDPAGDPKYHDNCWVPWVNTTQKQP